MLKILDRILLFSSRPRKVFPQFCFQNLEQKLKMISKQSGNPFGFTLKLYEVRLISEEGSAEKSIML